MKEHVSLEQYRRAEQAVAATEGRRGLLAHAWVTLAVVVGLVAINIFLAPEFPWSVFPAVGMGIGLAFHYLGVRHLVEEVAARQDKIEREATRLGA